MLAQEGRPKGIAMILVCASLVQETYQIARGDDLSVHIAGDGAAEAGVGPAYRACRLQSNGLGGDVESPRQVSLGHVSELLQDGRSFRWSR